MGKSNNNMSLSRLRPRRPVDARFELSVLTNDRFRDTVYRFANESSLVAAVLVQASILWMSDEHRQTLKPHLHKLQGSENEPPRQYLAVDWAVRSVAPLALDQSPFSTKAALLRNLSPITDKVSANNASLEINDLMRELSRAEKPQINRLNSMISYVGEMLDFSPDLEACITNISNGFFTAGAQLRSVPEDELVAQLIDLIERDYQLQFELT